MCMGNEIYLTQNKLTGNKLTQNKPLEVSPFTVWSVVQESTGTDQQQSGEILLLCLVFHTPVCLLSCLPEAA